MPAKPAGKAAKKEENQLPIEKSRVADLPEEPEAEAFPEEPPAEEPKPEKTGGAEPKVRKIKKEKAAGDSSNKNVLIVIGVVVVGILVLAAAGYYAYNKFLNPQVEITKPVAMNPVSHPKPPKPPAPVVEPTKNGPGTGTPVAANVPPEKAGKPGPIGKNPPAPAPKPAATPTPPPAKPAATTPAPKTPLAPPAVTKGPAPKPSATVPAPVTPPAKPGKPGPVAAAPTPPASNKLPAAAAKPQPIKVTPVAPGKPTKPSKPGPAPAAPMAAKPLAPAGPVNLPTRAPSTGWSCQVGAYMLWESFDTPLAGVRGAGYSNLYYVDRDISLTVYTLSLTGQFDAATANAKAQSLVGIGFRPHLEPVGSQYRVVAYKYGKRSVAEQSKSKIEQAKLGPCEITSQKQNVTLHQLRIGAYASRSEALKVLETLRAKGFTPELVSEK